MAAVIIRSISGNYIEKRKCSQWPREDFEECKALKKMKMWKFTGQDEDGARILQRGREQPYLNDSFFPVCLNDRKVSEDWKASTIVRIYKNGDINEWISYT